MSQGYFSSKEFEEAVESAKEDYRHSSYEGELELDEMRGDAVLIISEGRINPPNSQEEFIKSLLEEQISEEVTLNKVAVDSDRNPIYSFGDSRFGYNSD